MDGSYGDLPEKEYNSFVINRILSFHSDSILQANDMNMYKDLPKKMQFHYLMHSVRPRNRFSKWYKPEKNENINIIKEYYGYSTSKAEQVLDLLSEEQIEALRIKMNKGG